MGKKSKNRSFGPCAQPVCSPCCIKGAAGDTGQLGWSGTPGNLGVQGWTGPDGASSADAPYLPDTYAVSAHTANFKEFVPFTFPENSGEIYVNNISKDISNTGYGTTNVNSNFSNVSDLTITPSVSGMYHLTSTFCMTLIVQYPSHDYIATIDYYLLKDYNDSGIVSSFDVLESVISVLTPQSMQISVKIDKVVHLDAGVVISIAAVVTDYKSTHPFTKDNSQNWDSCSLMSVLMKAD